MIKGSLDFFFSHFAVDVLSGGVIFKAILDQPDEVVGQFAVSTDYVLTAKSSDVSGLQEGDKLTINLEQYEVRTAPRKFDDGAMSKVALNKVS